MKDFSGYSDDELLDELDFISLELSCCMGTDEYNKLEKIYWLVIGEINKREITLDEEGNKEEGFIESWRNTDDEENELPF